ncbi:MAG: hypothetical protein JW709_11250 [Sedimentisphaerales bacterium]|nr:hypothetical protein [Sedimentisphaerales bacterium]
MLSRAKAALSFWPEQAMDRTRQNGWFILRDATAVDNPLLTTATAGALSLPTGAKPITTEFANAVEIMLAAAGNDGDTIDYILWAGRDGKGPARKVCSGTFTLGASLYHDDPSGQLSGTPVPTRFADTVTITGSWLKTIHKSNDDDADGIAGFYFDFFGYDWLYLEITDKAGTVTRMVAFYSYV